jgi:hypothetical protein
MKPKNCIILHLLNFVFVYEINCKTNDVTKNQESENSDVTGDSNHLRHKDFNLNKNFGNQIFSNVEIENERKRSDISTRKIADKFAFLSEAENHDVKPKFEYFENSTTFSRKVFKKGRKRRPSDSKLKLDFAFVDDVKAEEKTSKKSCLTSPGVNFIKVL